MAAFDLDAFTSQLWPVGDDRVELDTQQARLVIRLARFSQTWAAIIASQNPNRAATTHDSYRPLDILATVTDGLLDLLNTVDPAEGTPTCALLGSLDSKMRRQIRDAFLSTSQMIRYQLPPNDGIDCGTEAAQVWGNSVTAVSAAFCNSLDDFVSLVNRYSSPQVPQLKRLPLDQEIKMLRDGKPIVAALSRPDTEDESTEDAVETGLDASDNEIIANVLKYLLVFLACQKEAETESTSERPCVWETAFESIKAQVPELTAAALRSNEAFTDLNEQLGGSCSCGECTIRDFDCNLAWQLDLVRFISVPLEVKALHQHRTDMKARFGLDNFGYARYQRVGGLLGLVPDQIPVKLDRLAVDDIKEKLMEPLSWNQPVSRFVWSTILDMIEKHRALQNESIHAIHPPRSNPSGSK